MIYSQVHAMPHSLCYRIFICRHVHSVLTHTLLQCTMVGQCFKKIHGVFHSLFIPWLYPLFELFSRICGLCVRCISPESSILCSSRSSGSVLLHSIHQVIHKCYIVSLLYATHTVYCNYALRESKQNEILWQMDCCNHNGFQISAATP